MKFTNEDFMTNPQGTESDDLQFRLELDERFVGRMANTLTAKFKEGDVVRLIDIAKRALDHLYSSKCNCTSCSQFRRDYNIAPSSPPQDGITVTDEQVHRALEAWGYAISDSSTSADHMRAALEAARLPDTGRCKPWQELSEDALKERARSDKIYANFVDERKLRQAAEARADAAIAIVERLLLKDCAMGEYEDGFNDALNAAIKALRGEK